MNEEQLRRELERAYRCIQGLLHAQETNHPFAYGYHQLTIGAAKRYVFLGELDGSEYFIGKDIKVLQEALDL
jgi:hypothetical protein